MTAAGEAANRLPNLDLSAELMQLLDNQEALHSLNWCCAVWLWLLPRCITLVVFHCSWSPQPSGRASPDPAPCVLSVPVSLLHPFPLAAQVSKSAGHP